jgi:hypothetical protein
VAASGKGRADSHPLTRLPSSAALSSSPIISAIVNTQRVAGSSCLGGTNDERRWTREAEEAGDA